MKVNHLAPLLLLAACSAPHSVPTVERQLQSYVPTWANGQQIPASFPNSNFGQSGPMYQKLPASPTIASNSQSVMSYYYSSTADSEGGWVDANSAQAVYDYNYPVYVAKATDPIVTVWCTGCSSPSFAVNLPMLAKPAGGTDHHLAVIEPNGVEYDFWDVSTVYYPYQTGDPLSAQGDSAFYIDGLPGSLDPYYVAPGFNSAAATAGGIAVSEGQIYVSELQAGIINHALSINMPCGSNAWVFPATQVTGICANGQGMPLGSRIWWAPTNAATASMNLGRDMTTILNALHNYGGYFTDNGGGSNGAGSGLGTKIESQEVYWLYGGGVDPVLNYVSSNSEWSHVVAGTLNRYLLSVPSSSLNLTANMKLLAP